VCGQEKDTPGNKIKTLSPVCGSV